jgi:hypothetical protein
MAAGLGFKTFNTGDVLSAADTNGYLMQNVWVFANATARTAAVTSPQEGNFSFLKDTNSTEYYDGAAWVAVGGGGGGGGKVLQVVQGTSNTLTSTSSSTYTDTTLSATITPSASTSKVMAIVSQQIQHSLTGTSGTEMFGETQLVRASTSLISWRFGNRYASSGSEMLTGTIQSMSYLDTPATTSATTYKTQLKNLGSGSTTVQPGNSFSTIILLEIGA